VEPVRSIRSGGSSRACFGRHWTAAGRYRVVAVIDETTVWDEKVTVEAGKDTTLDLSQSTSPVPVGRFATGT
jgi:hypothetical protein